MSDIVDQAIVTAMVAAREAGLTAAEFLQAVATATAEYSTFADAPERVSFVCGAATAAGPEEHY